MLGFAYAYLQAIGALVVTMLLAGALGFLLGRRQARRSAALQAAAHPTQHLLPALDVSPGPAAEEPDHNAAPGPVRPTDASSGQDSDELADARRDLAHAHEELARLETAAVSAWDRTVPALEGRIAELERDNQGLAAQLSETRSVLHREQETARRHRDASSLRARSAGGSDG